MALDSALHACKAAM